MAARFRRLCSRFSFPTIATVTAAHLIRPSFIEHNSNVNVNHNTTDSRTNASALCGDSDTDTDAMTQYHGLVHPLVIELEKMNSDRMRAWDNEDFVKYMEPAKGHDDIRVEVWSAAKTMIIECSGYDDYEKQFGDILKSFVSDRKIKGFHTMLPANYTIHVDGTVTLTMDWTYHEQSATEDDAEKQWKVSGYSTVHWAPLKSGSKEVGDWKIQKYAVFQVETHQGNWDDVVKDSASGETQ